MNEAPYTSVPDAEIEKLLNRVLPEIAGEIGMLRLPHLRAVVLGGGYGRGEGGVLHAPSGSRLYNDLDFFVFSEGADAGDSARIDAALKELSVRWGEKLGIAADFGPVKNLSSLRRVAPTLMFQELLRGWKPVWGEADLRKWIPMLPAPELPYSEAVRLLLNRGMGLAFAGEYLKSGREDPDFIVRNMNKAVLGGGDALLIASGGYRWSAGERVPACAEYLREAGLPSEYARMYENAFRWKREPEPVLPPDPAGAWRKCRRFYLDSVARCAGVPAGAAVKIVAEGVHRRAAKEGSLKNALRWFRRSRLPRSPFMFFDPPVITVLTMLYAVLAERDDYAEVPGRLLRLWRVFN